MNDDSNKSELPGAKPNLQRQILEALIDGEELTTLTGLQKFKTLEMRKFVSNLRAEGWKIADRWAKNPGSEKRYKVYYLNQD